MSLTEDNKLFHTNHFYIKIEFNLKWSEINDPGLITESLR